MEINTQNLIKTLPRKFKTVAKGIELYENEKHFAPVRFTQDTIVNWVPKAVLARSLTDFSEVSFLEFSENILVYFGGKFLNDKIFKKIFLKKLAPELAIKTETSAVELLKDKNSEITKKVMPIKAALAVCGLIIPLAEYSLSYVKNIFTVKLFKQADFNNIANLNKDKKEDIAKQKKVKESAIKHIKIAGGIFAGCLGFATLLATRGKNSKTLQSISEAILTPGTKIFKPKLATEESIKIAAKKAANFNKYFGLDSSKLSRGQLTACVVAGFFGYTGAAKDRGKQNFLEVLFRYPIVGFYVITGSDMFEKGFKNILRKNGNCKELLDVEKIKNEMPQIEELHDLAKDLASKNKTSVKDEFTKLLKQKATIIGVPLVFSLVVMGLFVAGMSRFFTQYRYNKELASQKNNPFNNNNQRFEMSSFGQKKV